uniref:SWIM-type domain-containing protein n=1 Tax=Manihot esculenta TaxID=3983 RepID=A0A251KLH9_MANES
MPRKKLILICQFGGEFVTSDDGEGFNHEDLPKRAFNHEDLPKRAGRPRGTKRAKTVPAEASQDAAGTPSVAHVDDATAPISPVLDMNATPADTVKKRRRTVSRKVGASDPATDKVNEARKSTSRKKNSHNYGTVAIIDEVEQAAKQSDVPWVDISLYSSTDMNSNDVSLEEMIAAWKDGIIGVGQEFKNVAEFRDALQKYAIAHRFVYRLKKNDTNRASGICVAEGCSWSIHASWVPSDQVFRIKKMNKAHTCEGESWKAAHPAKSWLVSVIKDRLRDSPHHKPKDIAKSVLQDFGIELSYTQVRRGLEEARKQLQGSHKEAYSQLPWFCDKMVEANPGSFVKLFIDDDSKFQRLFVSFHAAIHGFKNGCRPLLFLDSTNLKSKFHEVLLTATALDGDDGAFPVAFAVVDIENDNNWHWFLEQLKSAISTSQSLTFVSDKEKGLTKSVLQVFENAHHGYSIYPLLDEFMRNLRGPFHGDGMAALPASFLAAAHTVRLDNFRMFTEKIKQVSPKAYNWLMQIEKECWTNAFFKGELYNQITVNIAELYSNWIEELWELPVTQKVESLGCKMMELMHKREMDSNGWTTKLTPSKEKKLQEETLDSLAFKVLFSSDTVFEVHGDSIYVVDIVKRDCSCMTWELTGLPCRHAIAVFSRIGKSVYDYCSKHYTVDSFRSTYSKSINPVLDIFKPLDEEDASEVKQVLPPTTPRPPTQLKEKQIRRMDELKRVMTCSRCKGQGHNKITCKEPL